MAKKYSALEPAHLEVMEEVLQQKRLILNKYMSKIGTGDPDDEENPGNDVNEDVIYAFTKIADSVEDSIVKVSKLKLQAEKNAIDEQQGENMQSVLLALFEQDSKKKQHAPDPGERVFESTGMELDGGVLIQGEDNDTLDNFKERNK